MKIGLIADVHSNAIALKTVIEYMEAQGCEEYFLLGDYISDTASPEETMKLLYELQEKYPCTALRGNREEYMLEQRKVLRGEADGPRWLRNSASGNLLFTYERLTEKDLNWFESLPISFVYEKEGYPAITCCHGSPTATRQLLQLESEEAKHVLDHLSTDYFVAAHTHYQGTMEYGGKLYVNPGSLGISIGAPGIAQCAILESVEVDGQMCWQPRLLNIPFDCDTVLRDIFASGLFDAAHWFINNNIHILLTGIDLTPDIVNNAKRLQTEATGKEAIWPYIEEQYFAASAELLSIPDYACLREKY